MESKPKLEDVENAAAAWLVRRDSADWSAADEQELTRWLSASPSHRVSYIRQLSVWRDADRLKSLSAGFPKGRVPPRGVIEQLPFFAIRRRANDSPPRVRTRRSLNAYAAVTIAAIALGIGIAAYTNGFLSSGRSFSTPVGGLATVPTADGSIITLNTDTAVKVQLDATERRIELKRGEAFFDVAKDPSRPFVVYAHGQRVIAVGTKFSVRLNPRAVRVAVTEGKVRLEMESKPYSRMAVAGNVADLQRRHFTVEQRPMLEIEQGLSWRNGYVVLNGTPLPDAVAEFNRYNTRQLVIEDPTLDGIKVGGNFRATNIDGFVRLVEQAFDVDAQSRDELIVLKRKN